VDGGSLLILTGPPGAGKTTVGKIIAAASPLSACISADWFWTTIVNGHVPPWEVAADDQNRVMIRSATATGVRMANAGYTTVLEGIFGPWQFGPLRTELAACRVRTDYVVLRPGFETCLKRAQRRVLEGAEHRDALTEEVPIRQLWLQFSDLGEAGLQVIDSSGLDAHETARVIQERLDADVLRFSGA
jgi:hypothetical protein